MCSPREGSIGCMADGVEFRHQMVDMLLKATIADPGTHDFDSIEDVVRLHVAVGVTDQRPRDHPALTELAVAGGAPSSWQYSPEVA